VQPHLKKVFENMQEIEFNAEKKILAMFSAEKEKVGFVRPVDPLKKNVEDWMGEVEEMMQLSVRAALHGAVKDYTTRPRTDWVLIHPGQCILNSSQIVWTSEVEEALRAGVKAVETYFQKLSG
jgi:dynein heavy chain